MKYKVGDKVRIKEEHLISLESSLLCKEAFNDIKDLNTNGVLTVDRKAPGYKDRWIAKELKWKWHESCIELAEAYKEPIPINSRFELLF